MMITFYGDHDRLVRRDYSLHHLLDLHGQVLVIDEKGGYWVKFEVYQVPVTRARPHGLSYSLTLHAASGERLVGFDNAHQVTRDKLKPHDHMHRAQKITTYDYHDAEKLLEDFWKTVENFIQSQRSL
jgi:hypothetical protein